MIRELEGFRKKQERENLLKNPEKKRERERKEIPKIKNNLRFFSFKFLYPRYAFKF